MFGADGAAEICDDIVDDAVDLFTAYREGCRGRALGRHRIVMDVAVAEVPECKQADAGNRARQGSIGACNELRHARDWYRYVMLDASAASLLRFSLSFAEHPKAAALRLRLSQHRVDHKLLLQSC